mgnify:CR=1 FL=1
MLFNIVLKKYLTMYVSVLYRVNTNYQSHFTFNNQKLQHYLLQLVQALRYEHSGSPLLEFLIHRSLNSFNIASYTFWYLSVEADDTSRKDQSLYYNLLCQFKERLNEVLRLPSFINNKILISII